MLLFHLAIHLPFDVFFSNGLTFFVLSFAFGQGDFQFGPTLVVEIDAKRNNGEAFGADLFLKFVDFSPIQQKFSDSLRFMVENIGIGVGADVGADQKGLAVFEIDEGIFEVDPVVAQRFDFRSGEDQPGLQFVYDFIVVKCFAIDGYNFHGFFANRLAYFGESGKGLGKKEIESTPEQGPGQQVNSQQAKGFQSGCFGEQTDAHSQNEQ